MLKSSKDCNYEVIALRQSDVNFLIDRRVQNYFELSTLKTLKGKLQNLTIYLQITEETGSKEKSFFTCQ